MTAQLSCLMHMDIYHSILMINLSEYLGIYTALRGTLKNTTILPLCMSNIIVFL